MTPEEVMDALTGPDAAAEDNIFTGDPIWEVIALLLDTGPYTEDEWRAHLTDYWPGELWDRFDAFIVDVNGLENAQQVEPPTVEPPLLDPADVPSFAESGEIAFNDIVLSENEMAALAEPMRVLIEERGWPVSEYEPSVESGDETYGGAVSAGFYLGMQFIQSVLNRTGLDIEGFMAADQPGQGGIYDVGEYLDAVMNAAFATDSTGDEPPVLGPGGYQPGTNLLPADYRWVTDWGEGNPEIAAFIQKWLDRFQANHVATGEAGDPKFDPEQMKTDFLHGGGTDPDGGLFDQTWWQQAEGDYANMAEMWYSYGGPGAQEFVLGLPSAMGFGAPSPDWAGVPNSPWNTIWNDHLRIINEVIEDLGLTGLEVGGEWIIDMAGKLMARGGATYRLDPRSRENWNEEAVSMVERALLGADPTTPGFFDPETGQVRTPGITVTSGSILDWEKKFRGRAAAHLYDGITDEQFRKWAVDVKAEQGLNEEQVMDAIDDEVFSSSEFALALTDEERERMRISGGTIGGRVAPLRTAATQYTWEDESYTLNDPWLMDHYLVEEDGAKRFRSAAEMRDVARTNLDRFQHSSKYQDPMNDFITGAAAMFRSDF